VPGSPVPTKGANVRIHSCARAARLGALLVLAAGLAACAKPGPLYNWQSYQPAVRAYLTEDGADYASQVQIMEANIETARSASQALPPGFRAHLGMLYLKQGQGDKALEQFVGEKNAFGEATPFMDFLMRGYNPPVQAAEPVSLPAGD